VGKLHSLFVATYKYSRSMNLDLFCAEINWESELFAGFKSSIQMLECSKVDEFSNDPEPESHLM
jgi:hypothetical protein